VARLEDRRLGPKSCHPYFIYMIHTPIRPLLRSILLDSPSSDTNAASQEEAEVG
jgi:hypothetical protein